MAEAYLGKWMKVDAAVADIKHRRFLDLDLYVVSAQVDNGTNPFNGTFLTLQFAPAWRDQLAPLRRNSKIEVVGRIEGITNSSMVLDCCELV